MTGTDTEEIIDDSEFDTMLNEWMNVFGDMVTQKETLCVCGADKSNVPYHFEWCDKYKEYK